MELNTKCHDRDITNLLRKFYKIDDSSESFMQESNDPFPLLSFFFLIHVGFGVDEQSMISLLTKLHPDQRQSFRKSSPRFFSHDDRLFEKWEHDHIKQLEIEFSRFKVCVCVFLFP